MKITIPAGDHIQTAFARAIEAARIAGRVSFDFNGRTLTVSASDTVEGCMAEWTAENERARAAYLASPEYAAQQARYAEAEVARLARVGALRTFPLHAALTLATGRVWGPFAEAKDAAEWLLNEDPATTGMAIMADAMRREVTARYPHLGLIEPSEYPTSPDDVAERLAAQVALYGETVTLPCGCITSDEQRAASAASTF